MMSRAEKLQVFCAALTGELAHASSATTFRAVSDAISALQIANAPRSILNLELENHELTA